ncbi:MAG: hypothetical protein R6T90_05205 [Dissulfuribacterales bacterium]
MRSIRMTLDDVSAKAVDCVLEKLRPSVSVFTKKHFIRHTSPSPAIATGAYTSARI